MVNFLKFSINLLLDFVYPPTCCGCNKIGTFLCPACFSFIHFYSQPLRINLEECYLDQLFVMSPYDGVIKKMITKYKYQGVIDIDKTLANLINFYFNLPQVDLITDIPITKQKRNKRGFNQTEQICLHLSRITKQKYLQTLIKTGNFNAQASMKSKKQRINNLKNTFIINPHFKKYLQKNKIESVLIIDDVITTGTTLNEAAKTLKNNGIKKVSGFAIAHGN